MVHKSEYPGSVPAEDQEKIMNKAQQFATAILIWAFINSVGFLGLWWVPSKHLRHVVEIAKMEWRGK